MKTYLIIFLITLTIASVAWYNLGAFDRFNLRSNTLEVTNKCPEHTDDLILKFIGHPIKVFYEKNKQSEHKTHDWYGKNRISIHIQDTILQHHFYDFKKASWHKVNYSLEIRGNENQLFFDWKLKTLWYSNEGIDTIPVKQ